MHRESRDESGGEVGRSAEKAGIALFVEYIALIERRGEPCKGSGGKEEHRSEEEAKLALEVEESKVEEEESIYSTENDGLYHAVYRLLGVAGY